MSVTEYPPPAALAPFVDAFWSHAADQSTNSVAPQRILPDGCLDIVVGPRHAIVVGAMTRPIVAPPSDGAGQIWPDGEEVADHVGSALGTDRAISRLAETLTSRLSRIATVPPDLLMAVERIIARGGRMDVSRLATSLGVTRQHLARRFAAHVGVPPKTFCRVIRLWKVLRSTGGGRVNWAGLAADLGYSDQSHLVTEFRSLTGLTPSRWIATRRAGSKSPSRQVLGSLW